MTTLVTGAFGCIGSWVIRGLLADGERPVAFDLGDDPWRLRMIAGDDVASRVILVRGDIADRVAIGDVAAHQDDARGDVVAGDHAQAPRIVAEIEGHRPLTVGEQAADDPRADAAERAGHQGRHGPRTISPPP